MYWFCHTSAWIWHRCTRVPHPELTSHLPPHTIPLDHPSAPAPSILYPASNLDWQFISYMILYMFQCHSPKSSHPLPLPQSPKDCSIHLYLFCCLAHFVIEAIILTIPLKLNYTYLNWLISWCYWKIRSLEKEMATHSSTLAWKIPWTEEPRRLQSMGSQRVGHDWPHIFRPHIDCVSSSESHF